MKKKIKLEAWKNSYGEVFFQQEGCTFRHVVESERLPEFDIEREVEVPDEEPRKPRTFRVSLHRDGRPKDVGICAVNYDPEGEIIDVVEVMPDSISLTKAELLKICDGLNNNDYLCGSASWMNDFCRAFGLDEK